MHPLLSHRRRCESHCSGNGDADDESSPYFRVHHFPLLIPSFLRDRPTPALLTVPSFNATSHQAGLPEDSVPIILNGSMTSARC